MEHSLWKEFSNHLFGKKKCCAEENLTFCECCQLMEIVSGSNWYRQVTQTK